MAIRDVRVTVAAKVHDGEGGVHDAEIEIPVGGYFTKEEVDGTRTRTVHLDFGYGAPSDSVTIKMPPRKV